MITYSRYKPKDVPDGYRIEMVTCGKCNGTRFFSGKYGMTACEECSNGYKYRLVKMRKKKSNV
jgi:hypothetical protein